MRLCRQRHACAAQRGRAHADAGAERRFRLRLARHIQLGTGCWECANIYLARSGVTVIQLQCDLLLYPFRKDNCTSG
jgi:hypothetical protein